MGKVFGRSPPKKHPFPRGLSKPSTGHDAFPILFGEGKNSCPDQKAPKAHVIVLGHRFTTPPLKEEVLVYPPLATPVPEKGKGPEKGRGASENGSSKTSWISLPSTHPSNTGVHAGFANPFKKKLGFPLLKLGVPPPFLELFPGLSLQGPLRRRYARAQTLKTFSNGPKRSGPLHKTQMLQIIKGPTFGPKPENGRGKGPFGVFAKAAATTRDDYKKFCGKITPKGPLRGGGFPPPSANQGLTTFADGKAKGDLQAPKNDEFKNEF
ncbi:hypothetical protein GWK47_021814 [Chionoecetes opilio]|uniref:Uncharacterized protein n=1 Tax=Chionoecetes opilio TaxID=41210 RepID=A0A8J4XNF4_CHIOP|nr:hypothetical protein GWK47_021814 [Chionoecetes opilio]